MADTQLTTTGSGSGAQAATQSPQSVGQSPSSGAQASSVQPGTATSLLNGQSGVTLRTTALSTVNLDGGNAASTAASLPANPPAKHHANPALFGFSGLLLVVAVVLFWTTSRSVKNTTQY